MDQVHDSLDNLFTEVDHLDRITDNDELSEQQVELALSVAKKVRRAATNVVRALAVRRDEG